MRIGKELIAKKDIDSGSYRFIATFTETRIYKLLFVFTAVVFVLIACEIVDPDKRRAALHLPPLGFKGDGRKGKEYFQRYCLDCHGQEGRGTSQGPPLTHSVYRFTFSRCSVAYLPADKG
jgi:hypothetical protein